VATRHQPVTTKQQIFKALDDLPEDTTVEEAMERLYVFYKIQQGIADADAGRKVSQEEARDRMKTWLP